MAFLLMLGGVALLGYRLGRSARANEVTTRTTMPDDTSAN
jgi:hypothetical protein